MQQPEDLCDPRYVKAVFDRCSDRYIVFSYVGSMGFTKRWRRQCVALMPAPAGAAPSGYDFMAGTGEVWPHLLARLPDIGAITAVDISSGMRRRALDRLHTMRAHRIAFIKDDLLASGLASESADGVVSTFGLRPSTPSSTAVWRR